MIEHIADVLVSQSIIERDSCHSKQNASYVQNSPLGSISGENSHESQIFSFWLMGQLFIDDAATKCSGFLEKLSIIYELD